MPAYLDHNATTPLEATALEAMLPYLREQFGNPSSVHRHGRRARAAIDAAREQVAALVNAHPSQVIFTGGGTEANNLAIQGIAARHRPGRILIGATEHPSVVEAATSLSDQGWHIEHLPVDDQGCLRHDALKEALQPVPALVSVMTANNETGVVQDMAAIAALVRDGSALLHTDAVQAAGKIALDFFGERRPSNESVGAQDRRAQGRGRADCRQGGGYETAIARRRAGEGSALGHGECRRDCRLRRRGNGGTRTAGGVRVATVAPA